MPVSSKSKKNLYLAKNLTELNARADDSLKIKDGQCRMFVKGSDKVFKNAEESAMLGDDERAYILYMKFLNILQGVRKTPEYKKNKEFYDNMMGRERLLKALQQAEDLSGDLKQRYEEQEAKEVSVRLKALDALEAEKPPEQEVIPDEETEKDTAINTDVPAPKAEEKTGLLSCEKLYNLMTDNSSSLLIFDIRPQDQFLNSHIKYNDCVNIPRNIVTAGCTVRHIEAGLPAESRDFWVKRGGVDFVVLLDWSCSEKDLVTGTPLCSLKDAMYKWDQDVVVKSEPLILDGGYEEWLNYYPTVTTNALVPRPPSYNAVSSTAMSLDKIDYDLDLDFLKTPEQKAAEMKRLLEEKKKDSNIPTEKQLPVVPDRTKKPTPGPFPNNMIIPNNSMTQIIEKSIERINNDLNNPNNKNSASARKSMEAKNPATGQVLKENNLVTEKQIKGMKKPPEPMMPDRTLKPKETNTTDTEPVNNASSSSVVSYVLEPERKASNENNMIGGAKPVRQDTKGEEEQQLEREKQSLVLETKARRVKLEEEKEQIEKLKRLKMKEAEETAALMRKKREVEEQLRHLEGEKNHKEEQEKLRQDARMKKLEEEKATAALRDKRKAQQADKEKAENERISKEESLKKEAERALLAKEEQKKQELARQEQVKREEEERQAREKYLLEEQKRIEEAEKLKKQEMERQIREEERKLAEMKQRQQEEENRKLQEERKRQDEAREKVQQEERERRQREEQNQKKRKEEAERKQKEQQQSVERTAVLPSGWERRWDGQKQAHYYINHATKTTQWDPPRVPAGSSSPQVAPKTASPQKQPTLNKDGHYTVKLKEDGQQNTVGGLKRSHSSPNIAKLMEEDGDGKPFSLQQPNVNRAQKPQKPSVLSRPEIKDLQRPLVFSEAKVRNFTPVWGSVGHGLTGLRNQGNTCYMNSTLQCMSNTGFLTTYLLTENYRHDINVQNKFGTRGEIAEEYCAVVKAMWSGQYKSITPRDFKLSTARHCSTFAGYDQQDSQEFLSYLLDWLHEDLNKIRGRGKLPEQENDGVPDEVAAERAWKLHKTVHDSVVVELFQGQYKSTVMCKVCQKKSVTFDTFMYLSLELPSKTRCTLRDCLLNFSQEEQMTGDSKWNCPKCRMKRNAVKRIVIWKLPPILIIVLKRFYQTGLWRQKNSANVDFPIEGADFQKFQSGPQTRKPFNLFAVSNHYGTMDGGHYTAFCKNPKLNRWFKFDDHEVYEYSKSDIKSAAAYFLFYTSIGQM